MTIDELRKAQDTTQTLEEACKLMKCQEQDLLAVVRKLVKEIDELKLFLAQHKGQNP